MFNFYVWKQQESFHITQYILILSIFYISMDLSINYFAHFSGCWASFVCSCHSILECCVMFSGVKLSIRSFVLFGDCHEMAHIWAKIQAFDQIFVLFEPAASSMQKINPVDCFNLCHWRFVYMHLFPVIWSWRKSSKSDFQSWRKKISPTISLFSLEMIA